MNFDVSESLAAWTRMSHNINMTKADKRDMDSRGRLKPRTLRDRKTESDAFMKYLEQEAGESDIKELDKTEAGRARISNIVAFGLSLLEISAKSCLPNQT